MLCPFLREARVNFCHEAPAAKALPLEVIDAASSRCDGPEHVTCPHARGTAPAAAPASRCPSLVETRVQYCAAVSAPKFIPSLDLLPSRCRSEAHRHCALFLDRAGASAPAPTATAPHRAVGLVEVVDGIEMPLQLGYTANHLWADRGADGSCTVGADGFLVRVIGHADRITFVSSWPGAQSFAVLSIAGLELALAFPFPLDRIVINYALRVEPDRLSTDPYGAGWLFEGSWSGETDAQADPSRRLVRGRDAVAWMHREVERLSLLVHEGIGARGDHAFPAAADGGIFAAGVARALRREDVLHLFSEFFSVSPASWSV